METRKDLCPATTAFFYAPERSRCKRIQVRHPTIARRAHHTTQEEEAICQRQIRGTTLAMASHST